MSTARTTSLDLTWHSAGTVELVLQAPRPAGHSGTPLTSAAFALDRFRPKRVLGRSSDKTRIMLVEDTIESRDLAVKVLDRACMTPLLEHQVLRGCRVQAACAANAHVLPLYAVLQDDAHIYVFTAAGERGDLAQFLAARGRTLTAAQAAKFVIKPLVSALVRLHAVSCAHRDIKPENLLIAKDGTVLLSDFDLAIDTKIDTPKSRVGTPDYIAPEVLRGSQGRNGASDYGCKVDVWAVGVLAWEVLQGKAPFTAKSTEEIKKNVLAGGEKIPGTWPAACQDFVRRCMQRDVSKRATAEELLAHDWMHSVA